MELPVSSTWLSPRCVDAVSEMYIILPSGATTNIKPSNVCNKLDPSSLIVGTRVFDGTSFEPHASPRPVHTNYTIQPENKMHFNFMMEIISIEIITKLVFQNTTWDLSTNVKEKNIRNNDVYNISIKCNVWKQIIIDGIYLKSRCTLLSLALFSQHTLIKTHTVS